MAQVTRALRSVVARVGPYRGPLPGRVAPVPCRVATRTRMLARLVAASRPAVSQPPRSRHRELCHDITPTARALRVVWQHARCRVVRCIATQKVTPSNDTVFVSRVTKARSQAVRVVGRIVSLLGHVVVVSCLAMRALVRPMSQYSLLYRDSKQKMGSSPASLPCTCLFFFTLFFLFQLLEDHKKKKNIYIYIYFFFFHFPVEQNKIIKIYFIYFFSRFTHCKTSEKTFLLNTFIYYYYYFPMCYSLRTQITQHTQQFMLYMSHPDSWSDPIGGSEPTSGCETIYWDSLPNFFFSKPNLYLWVMGPHLITESKYHIHIKRTTTGVVSIKIYTHLPSPIYKYKIVLLHLQIRARNLHVVNLYKSVGLTRMFTTGCFQISSPVPTRIKNPC